MNLQDLLNNTKSFLTKPRGEAAARFENSSNALLNRFNQGVINAPRFNFAEKIQNPFGRTAAQFGQGMLNIPSDIMSSYGKTFQNINQGETRKAIGSAGELGLNMAQMIPIGKGVSLAKQGAMQALKQTPRLTQLIKQGAKTGAKYGGGFGAGYGFTGSLQDDSNLLQTIGNTSRQGAFGTLAGVALGGGIPATGGVGKALFNDIRMKLNQRTGAMKTPLMLRQTGEAMPSPGLIIKDVNGNPVASHQLTFPKAKNRAEELLQNQQFRDRKIQLGRPKVSQLMTYSPEFKQNPILNFQNGMLEFKGKSNNFKLKPKAIGLDPAEMKNGMTVDVSDIRLEKGKIPVLNELKKTNQIVQQDDVVTNALKANQERLKKQGWIDPVENTLGNNNTLIQEARKYKSAEEFADWGVIMRKDPVVDGKNIGKDFGELKELVSYRKTSDFLKQGEYKFDEGVLKGKIGAGQELIQGKVDHWKARISKGERPIVIIEDKPYVSKITDNLQGGRQYDAILEARVRQGHSRLEAYRQLGIKKIPVVYKSQLIDIWNKSQPLQEGVNPLIEQAKIKRTLGRLGLDIEKIMKAEVANWDRVKRQTQGLTERESLIQPLQENRYWNDIQELAKKYGNESKYINYKGDDRFFARIADDHFNELDIETQKWLEFQAPGQDFESKIKPNYKGFSNADEFTSGKESVHGSQITNLREKIEQSQPLQEGVNPLIQEARKVEIKNLIDAEGESITKTGSKITKGEMSITKGPIDVVKTEDGWMVLDGQHRSVEALNNGQKFIDANILSSDEALKKYGDRWPHLKSVFESQRLQEGVKTGQLSNQSVPQAEGLKTTPKPPVESTPKTELSQDVRQLDSSKPSSYINTTTTDSKLLQTLNKALKEAKPVRGQQDALYAKARGQKMAIMMKARGKMAGEKGFFSEKGALAGSLPKVEYETIRKNFTQESVDRLFNMVKESKNIDEWDKIAAQEGLAKLLGESGMGVPTRNEIATMHKVFGQEFTETLLSKRPLLEKMKEMGMQIYNLPRSMMAGMGDFSATLMQNALFAYRHPVMTTKNFGQSLKYFGSDKFFKASMQEIGQRPNYELMKQAKVSFTDVSPIVTQREEEFMSSLAEKIPGIGRVIKASGRAYTGFLNKMRADVADSLIETKKLMGDELDERFLRSMGEFVNMGTGRGSLGKLEKSASVLSQGMFSARKLMATFNTLNPAFYVKADPLIRKEALKTMGAFFGGATTITGLAKLAGADVSTDPTNSDFGKIKIGNTRINLFGTYQQLVVLFARQLKGYATSSTSGKRMTLGEGYKPLNRLELFGRFFESKEHPTLSLITGAMEGQNAVGEDFDAATEGLRRIMPMIASDSYDLYNEHGAKGLLGIIPAMLGVFTQTYGKQIPTVEKTDSGKPTIKLKNTPDLSQTIVNKIRGTEMSNIPESQRASIVEQKNKESKLDYEKAQIKKGNVDDADLTDPEIKKYLKKTEMDKTKEEFINSDKSSMKVEGGYLRKSENGETATFISDSKYNSQLATQRMERAKKNKDMETWSKYAEQKYVNLQKQLNDPNTDQLEKETIQNDIEDLENQYAKYAGYSGFTKPKKGKTVKLNLKKIEGFDMPKISSSSIKISAPKKLNLKKLKIEKKKVKIKFNKTQAPSASKRLV